MRHRTHSPAYARLDASQPGVPDLSEILDISEEGMSIQTSSPLQVERNLSLCLDLSETRRVDSDQRTGGLVGYFGTGRNSFCQVIGAVPAPAQGMALCECPHRRSIMRTA